MNKENDFKRIFCELKEIINGWVSFLKTFIRVHRIRLLDIGLLIFGDLLSFVFIFEEMYLVENIISEESRSIPKNIKLIIFGTLFILITIKLIIKFQELLKELRKSPEQVAGR